MATAPTGSVSAFVFDQSSLAPVSHLSSQSIAGLYGFGSQQQQPQSLLYQAPDPIAQRAAIAKQFFTSGRANGWHADLELPHGYVASYGGPHIHLRGDPFFPEDVRALAYGNVAKWVPEGARVPHYQRCPFYAVDNICVRVINGQPHIAFGYWNKEKEVRGGRKSKISGLALAAGGHVEITGRPEGDMYDNTGGYSNQSYRFKEKGHMSEREAADAEMKEEICVDRRNVLYTERICSYESPTRDPRSHYQGACYFRYIAVPPSASVELKSVVMLSMATIAALIQRQPYMLQRPDGTVEECLLVLGHDILLDSILRLPNTVELMQKAIAFSASYGA